MGAEQIKLSYSSSQFRIRVSFSCSTCLDAGMPLDTFVKRAESKFQGEISAGNIAFYKVFGDELKNLWGLIRSYLADHQEIADNEIIFTLGFGSPLLPGVKIEAGDPEKVAYYITFDAPAADIKAWHFDFLKLNIEHQLSALGLGVSGNQAQLYAAFMRAGRGEVVTRRSISHTPKLGDDVKGYSLIVNKSRHEISLMVKKASLLQDRKGIEDMMARCEHSVAKYAEANNVKLEFFKARLIDRLKSSVRGCEFFGVGIPAMYLVAIPESVNVVAKGGDALPSTDSNSASPIEKVYPGKGLLKVAIDSERLSAGIKEFDVNWYQQSEFAVTWEWIQLELERLGIIYNEDSNIPDALKAAIEKKEDLNDFVVAKGTLSVAAKEPYIFESYKESKASLELNSDIDMREMQQRKIVNAGALVAEIRYKEPAVCGRDIFGTDLPMPPGEELTITAGNGIEVREQAYYATMDGLPKIENNVIELNQVLVHEGDVNLRTGNIRFNGAAEIKGSIDSGATVEVTGDLIVHGTIRDAYVRVGGSLDARSGVVTGTKGIVRVRNDVVAEFIENSKIICGGNLMVRKAILNCNICCGGSVKTPESTGVVAGGQISSLKNIETNKLGFPSGATTKVFAGVNYRAKLTLDIRQSRFERASNICQEDRNALRELVRRKEGQKTKKHEQMMVDLQDRVNRGRPLLEKLKLSVDAAIRQITFDEEARIIVKGILYSNVKIEIAGVLVPVTHEVAEVMITPKKSRGSYIQALVETQDKDGKDKPADKIEKAS